MMSAGTSGRLGSGALRSPAVSIAWSYGRQPAAAPTGPAAAPTGPAAAPTGPAAAPAVTSLSVSEPGSTSAGTRSSSEASATRAAGVQSPNSSPFSRAVLRPLTGTAMAPARPHAM